MQGYLGALDSTMGSEISGHVSSGGQFRRPSLTVQGSDKMGHRVCAHYFSLQPLPAKATGLISARLASLGLAAILSASAVAGASPARASSADESSSKGQSKTILANLQGAFSNIADESSNAISKRSHWPKAWITESRSLWPVRLIFPGPSPISNFMRRRRCTHRLTLTRRLGRR